LTKKLVFLIAGLLVAFSARPQAQTTQTDLRATSTETLKDRFQ